MIANYGDGGHVSKGKFEYGEAVFGFQMCLCIAGSGLTFVPDTKSLAALGPRVCPGLYSGGMATPCSGFEKGTYHNTEYVISFLRRCPAAQVFRFVYIYKTIVPDACIRAAARNYYLITCCNLIESSLRLLLHSVF